MALTKTIQYQNQYDVTYWKICPVEMVDTLNDTLTFVIRGWKDQACRDAGHAHILGYTYTVTSSDVTFTDHWISGLGALYTWVKALDGTDSTGVDWTDAVDA